MMDVIRFRPSGKRQAASGKRQAASGKRQAASGNFLKLRDDYKFQIFKFNID